MPRREYSNQWIYLLFIVALGVIMAVTVRLAPLAIAAAGLAVLAVVRILMILWNNHLVVQYWASENEDGRSKPS